MAGTIFGLPLSQQFTITGVPMSGAKLYLYLATTTTPATAYKDFGLTTGQEHPWPIEADATGRIPAFWLADGAYRARLTDSASTVQFDLSYVQTVGPSTGTGGGGSGSTTDATAVFATGDMLFVAKGGTRTGWVRHNARTIGSASSGAAERANADCEALYTYLWETYSNTLCPVSGGRGVSAAADWSANKPIATLDLRARAPVGLADMGNAAVGFLDSAPFQIGGPTTAAGLGGLSVHTLSTSETPAHAHTINITDPGHTHSVPAAGTFVSGSVLAGGSTYQPQSGTTGSSTTGITATADNTGGGGSHNNMQPFVLGTWFVKL